MNIIELELLEKWQEDPSFINWANQTNEADTAKWDAYFEVNQQYTELADIAKFSIINLKVQKLPMDEQRSHKALAALRAKIAESPKPKSRKVQVLKWSSTWSIAASFLLLASIGLWTFSSLNNVGDAVVWTTEGEKKEILLNDGTSVILNKNSSLSYNDRDVRNVQLDGEAFFNVTQQKIDNAPFTVTTKDLVVKVLGTQFNVNSDKEKTSVYLDEGKVQLALGENQEAPLEMLPGYLVRYAKNQNKILENRKADALENIAWKENVILFEESTLSEVLLVVSKVYGIDFELGTTIDDGQTFSGGIPVQDLNITLETLRNLYKLDIKKIEAKYLIESE